MASGGQQHGLWLAVLCPLDVPFLAFKVNIRPLHRHDVAAACSRVQGEFHEVTHQLVRFMLHGQHEAGHLIGEYES